MAALFRIGMLFFAVFGMAYLFINEVLSLGGKKNRLQKHLKLLRDSLAPIELDLVPMDREELGLLSMDRLKKRAKNASYKVLTGQFLSIYNEPALAYAWLKYSAYKSLLMIKSQDNEYHYLLNGDQVKMYVNGVHSGDLSANGEILGGLEAKDRLGSFTKGKKDRYQEIKNADGKLLASLYNPWVEERSNQRVIHFIADTINEDISMVKAITFLNLAQRSNIS